MNPGGAPETSTPRVANRFFEFSLLGMLTCGFAAVASSGTLDWFTASVAVGALVARASMVMGWLEFRLSSRAVAVLASAYLVFFPLDFYYLSGSFLAATVHMVVFLAVVKLLTARTARDFGYLEAVAMLEMGAAAVLSNGLAFLMCLALFVLFGIAALTSGEVLRIGGARVVISKDGLKAFPRRLGWLSACMFVGIVVMTAGMFFVLPRTARAAFSRFAPAQERLTAFSNSVTLGEIGQIKRSNSPVMHVRSYQGEGFLPVKWRGAALAEFDGKRWFNRSDDERLIRSDNGVVAVRTAVQGTRQGRSLIYQVHLEPLISEQLFFAGTPETIRIDVRYLLGTGSGTFRVSPRFGPRGLDYSVYAFLPDEWAEVRFTSAPLAETIRQELLRVPPLDPRIPRLAREVTAGAETEVQRARAIESQLRRDYGYTLDLLSTPVADPLAHFLFERRKGHCEYFASAMAIMLRTIGIPARVVTGFQSGVYNSMTGWQVIRAADAHSWVEAWLEGRGWTTFDPTPPDPLASGTGLLSQLSMLSDTLQQAWQDWVVSYDLDRQVALASRLQAAGQKLRLPHWDEIAGGWERGLGRGLSWGLWIACAAGLVILTLLLVPTARAWWERRQRLHRVQRGEGRNSDGTILYQTMLALLERRGVRKPPWLTPVEFAGVIRTPELAGLVLDATHAYNDLRYGGRSHAALAMMDVIRKIEGL